MRASIWKLRLFGSFELRSPGDIVVPVANRKVQALLAIVALGGPQGVSRQDVAAILWPELSIYKRSNNLRQTLARARNVIGADSLVSSRTHCRFADQFSIETDLDSPLAGAVFMPDCEGDWFDDIRTRSNGGRGKAESAMLMSGFVSVLEWLSEHDPSRMLGLMRENLGLSLGVSLDDRRRLLGQPCHDPSLAGWRTFFTAGMLENGYGSAAEQFRMVLAAAEAGKDRLLGVQASAQLSICAMMQNQFAEAESYAKYCASLAAGASDTAMMPTAIQIQGVALILGGRPAEGLPMLERAEQLYKVYLDSVIIQAMRAFYLSSYGHATDAHRCLELPNKVRQETGHGLLQILCALTEAKILARDLNALDSIENLKRAARLAEGHQDTRYTVVTHEELAKAYLRTGEVPVAKQRAREAKKLRSSMAMSYTPWDEMRLSARS